MPDDIIVQKLCVPSQVIPCPTCHQLDDAASSLLARQPEQFKLRPVELISGQTLYEPADDADGIDICVGEQLIESSKNCTTCRTLVTAITQRLPGQSPDPPFTWASARIWLFGPMCSAGCFTLLSPDVESDDEDNLYELRLVPSSLAKSSTDGISLVDLDMIRGWVELCDTQHKEQCYSLSNNQKRWAINFRMINVVEACLVPFTDDDIVPRYIALSYVWGRAETLLCTKANYRDLTTPGSLNKAHFSSKLARTISDAMVLTKGLGLRYLWADMLCITQDDPSDKVIQLPNMAAIYGDSYLNIFAVDGADSQSGIRGISDGLPRTFQPALLRLSDHLSFAIRPASETTREKLWHTRAWTMQERALSHRSLIFLDQAVSWSCMRSSFDEITYIPGVSESDATCYMCQAGSSEDICYVRKTKYPFLDNYLDLVRMLTERSLSYPEDILNAFAGILTELSGSFPHGFYQGIPEFYFDLAILWCRYEYDEVRRARRITRRCPIPGKRWASSKFASWSWAGWENCRVGWSTNLEDSLEDAYKVVPIFPVIEWGKTDGHRDLGFIRNDFHHYCEAAKSYPNSELTKGWEKVYEAPDPESTEDDNFHFEHSSVPDRKFRTPLPVEQSSSELPTLDLQSMYLVISGKVCSFSFREEEYESLLFHSSALGSLYSTDEVWSGIIYDIQSPTSSIDLEPLACQVLAISTGSLELGASRPDKRKYLMSAEQDFPELSLVPHLKEARVYEFYNVLWLAWEDGIAYRRGIGRVWKPVWEGQKLIEMKITLG